MSYDASARFDSALPSVITKRLVRCTPAKCGATHVKELIQEMNGMSVETQPLLPDVALAGQISLPEICR